MDDFKRMDKARQFPLNTCGSSRHLQIVAEQIRGGCSLEDAIHDPQGFARAIAAVVAELWERRNEAAVRDRFDAESV